MRFPHRLTVLSFTSLMQWFLKLNPSSYSCDFINLHFCSVLQLTIFFCCVHLHILLLLNKKRKRKNSIKFSNYVKFIQERKDGKSSIKPTTTFSQLSTLLTSICRPFVWLPRNNCYPGELMDGHSVTVPVFISIFRPQL